MWSTSLALGYSFKITSIASNVDVKVATKFAKGVQDNDVKALHKMIKKGFELNTMFRFESGLEKMTALHYAAKEGYLQVVRELVSSGSEVNVTTPFDQATPLYLACLHGENKTSTLPIVMELITGGADVNQGDHWGRTPLIVACEMGNLEVVRALLQRGASPDIAFDEEDFPDGVRHALKFITLSSWEVDEICDPYSHNTPLIQACREHHVPVVQELLKHNCDVTLINASGNAAIHIAAKSESRSTYSERLTRPPVAGSLTLVKSLIEKGCDVNVRNKNGDTPLKRAVDGLKEIAIWNISIEERIEEAKLFCDIIQYLVRSGSDASMTYRNNETALTSLLKSTAALKPWDCQSLDNKFLECLQVLIIAGSPVCSEDVSQAERHAITNPLAAAFEAMRQPFSLKRSCKLCLRRHVHVPVSKHIPTLELPVQLHRYLQLQVED